MDWNWYKTTPTIDRVSLHINRFERGRTPRRILVRPHIDHTPLRAVLCTTDLPRARLAPATRELGQPDLRAGAPLEGADAVRAGRARGVGEGVRGEWEGALVRVEFVVLLWWWWWW